ncbi:olfactory receptor 56A4-like [Gastrophryne carolinensis]
MSAKTKKRQRELSAPIGCTHVPLDRHLWAPNDPRRAVPVIAEPRVVSGSFLVADNSSSDTASNFSEDFIFICFPEVQSWDIASLFMLLLLVAIVANVILLLIIFVESRLHHPMYYFLSMLAIVDILLCTIATPKALMILWTDDKSITKVACFSQMFFCTYWSAMESSIMLVMAYDRYVAICKPLHYPIIITNAFVVKCCAFVVIRSLVIALPPPILAARLDYCSSREIRHCYCEDMSVQKISCSDDTPTRIYGLVAFVVFGVTDIFLIGVSYFRILQTVVKARSFHAACKAFRTCATHLIVISIFYFTVASTIVSSRAFRELPRPVHVIFAFLHQLLPPALNPLVYGVLTTEIRHTIQRIMGKIQIHP